MQRQSPKLLADARHIILFHPEERRRYAIVGVYAVANATQNPVLRSLFLAKEHLQSDLHSTTVLNLNQHLSRFLTPPHSVNSPLCVLNPMQTNYFCYTPFLYNRPSVLLLIVYLSRVSVFYPCHPKKRTYEEIQHFAADFACQHLSKPTHFCTNSSRPKQRQYLRECRPRINPI